MVGLQSKHLKPLLGGWPDRLNPNKGYFIFMQFSEKEFEDFVLGELQCNDGELFSDQDIPIRCLSTPNIVHWYRQVNLAPYGIADIIGVGRDRCILIVDIIELKITPSELSHFEQVLRYKTAVRHILKIAGFKGSFEINAWLFVKSFDDGAYLQNHCPVDVAEYSFSLRGFDFKHYRKNASWVMPSAEEYKYDYK
ncbi:MAG: hypothetical protein ABUT20_63385, partial [Bacteroidota bacterium]